MFDDILTTLWVIGALILLLQVMILISYWRRGSRYAAMEKVYRERQAEANLKAARRKETPLINWDLHEENREYPVDPTAWQIQAALDDPPRA